MRSRRGATYRGRVPHAIDRETESRSIVVLLRWGEPAALAGAPVECRPGYVNLFTSIFFTDYRYESRTGPLSCFTSTNPWLLTIDHQKEEICDSGIHLNYKILIWMLIYKLFLDVLRLFIAEPPVLPPAQMTQQGWKLVLAKVLHTI
jgi:hypothetical protein